MLKRTPLYPEYEKYGAKTVDFGGWDLPVQFSGIIQEHEMTRTKATLFDVSHMGEISIEGPDSLAFLQKMVTNNVANLTTNKAQYTFMCDENGGTVDDFLIYMLQENHYLLVVNAANIEKDVAWLNENHEQEEISITDKSNDYALLTVQGPLATQILQKITNETIADIKPFRFIQNVTMTGIEGPALISRTGYTGEDGYEIYIDQSSAAVLWRKILEAGGDDIQPAGLGARDSLRFEAGLPLYGQELSKGISPIEAGLQFAVKIHKPDEFIGKEVLKHQIEVGTKRKLVGLEMIDKGIPRTNYDVLNEAGNIIGQITSGTQSPTLKKAIGFALIDQSYSQIDTEVFVQVRKRRVKGVVIKTPFYKR